jgi:SPP1 family predicted phage head-tail adaptor
MQAGRLDRRLKLFRRTITRGTGGEAVIGYAHAGTEWAARLPLTEQEVAREVAIQGQATVKFRIRYRPDVKTEWRGECDGVMYEITGVDEIGRRAGLNLKARGAVE